MFQFTQEEYEDLLHGMSNSDKDPLSLTYELIDETRDFYQEIVLTGSSINALSVNPFFWATKQLLGVSFNSNYNMIIGDMVHAAVETMHLHFLEHGEHPDIRTALVEAAKKGRYGYYNFLPDSARDKSKKEYRSLRSLYFEAKPMFELYCREILPHTHPIECERRMNHQLTDDDGNPLNIRMSGKFDRRDRIYIADKQYAECVVDVKTSKTNIRGEIIEDQELDELKVQLKEASKKPKKDERTLALEDAIRITKRKPAKSETQKELELKIRDAKKLIKAKRTSDEDRAQAESDLALFEQQLESEIERISSEHEKAIIEAEADLAEYLSQREKERQEKIDTIQAKIDPLQELLDALQYENDCLAAKKKHGKQLAFYALLIMILDGIEVKYGRIELIIRHKEPEVRVFEFSIEDEVKKLINEIDTITELIALWRSGTPSRLLFRPNPDTYIGSELMELIDSIEAMDEIEPFEPLSNAA